MVARDMVLPEFTTLSAGMVAHSIPKNENMVIAADEDMAFKTEPPLLLKG